MPEKHSYSFLVERDAQAQTAQFVQEHVERFGDTRSRHSVALDNSLVSFGTAGNVVGLDGEDFLE